MKALIISPQPFFSPRGTPFSVYYRTLITAELGVEIDLLTYGQGEDVEIPGVNIIRIPRFSFLGDVKIGPSFLKLFLDIFIFIRAVALLLRKDYDFVHAHEEAVFFCAFLKPFFRYKLVYDMHSSLPQQLKNFEFTNSELIMSVFKTLEDKSLKAADAIITICPDLRDYADSLIENKEKHIMIENSIFDPVKLRKTSLSNDYNEIFKKPDLPENKKFIVYAGTLEPYQGIDILIQAFSIVVKEVSDAFLIIVGGNKEQVEKYSGMAKKLGISDSVLFTGKVPQHVARKYCTGASIQVSPRSKGTNTPLKIYEQLASGIPLVATDIYSHTQALNSRVACLVPPTPYDMAKGIAGILKSETKGRTLAENALKLYKEKYSRPVYVDKMKKLLSILS